MKRWSIRHKMLYSMYLVALLSILGVGVTSYIFTIHAAEDRTKAELDNVTRLTYEKIAQTTDAAIKNYLRAIAEKNKDVVSFYYNQYKEGLMTEEQAKKLATEVLLSQRIGESGYIYAVNSEGSIVVHPVKSLIGSSLSDQAFFTNQMRTHHGYVEYMWKNPEEALERSKALYMDYFEPWDWIIAVSSYREEFNQLINIHDYEKDLLSVKLGKTGYIYIMDLKGNLIIHPFLEGENIADSKDEKGKYFIKEVLEKKNGSIVYPWRNEGEIFPRDKIVIYKSLDELGYIVAGGVYLDELYSDVRQLGFYIAGTTGLAILFALVVSYRLSRSLTKPIVDLKEASEEILRGNYSVRATQAGNDEIGDLSHAFNNMVTQIEQNYEEIVKQKERIESDSRNLEEMVEQRTQELHVLKEQAESDTQAKSDFLANMSHEIRTPINAITGFTYLMGLTQMDAQQNDYTNKIEQSAQLLLGLINDILDFSKIEAGRLELESVPFNLQKLISEVTDMLSVKAIEKNLALTYHMDSEIPELLLGDPLRLRQILINLMNNAIKFTEKGQIEVNVGLVAACDQGYQLAFAVTDSGVGIPEDKLGTIFCAFTQSDNSISRHYGGTGLGLSITKQLVQLMGGEIQASSQLGRGSCFAFNALFNKASETDIANYVYEVPSISTVSFHGKTALVVEDNHLNQQIIKEILIREGFHVSLASDGQQAVSMATSGKYDLILMDVQMPQLNGYEATRLIRKYPELSKVPIIALTAHAIKGIREGCLEAGMNDYISKPIELQALTKILHQWVAPSDIVVSVVQKELVESTVDEDLCFVLSIPQLDHAAGLERLAGSAEFYREFLEEFAEDFETLGEELWQAFHKQDFDLLRNKVHLLSGVSGNLDIKQVHLLAKTLESQLKADVTNVLDGVLLAQLIGELDIVIDAIENARNKC